MSKVASEKVIFREEYDKYMDMWKFLAVFADYKEYDGSYDCASFYFDKYGHPVFESMSPASLSYLHTCKIIHKKDNRIPQLVKAVEEQYGIKVQVCEKIMK